MSYILETKDARFSYETGEAALSGVSVRIAEGKKTVLLGPNGSGKSTLFLHMNGVLKPQKGMVLFRGEPIKYDRANIASLRQKVCLMFQNPDDQIFAATVEEDVAFGPLNLKLSSDVVEKRVEEALCAVDMQKYRDRPTQQLSYGQRKRVAMAGALAMDPELLLMDEPTAGLDVQMVREMLEFSDELNFKGKTLVISTHDVETAYEWADNVILMYEGGVLFSGSVDELFEQEELLHKARLTRPVIYHLNVQRHLRTGEPESPRPHTLPECCQVFFKNRENVVPGTLYLACVDDSGFDPALIGKFKKHNRGAFGSVAKRVSRDMSLELHHYFNSLEHGLTKTSRGEDYLLVTESVLEGLVRDKAWQFAEHSNCEITIITASRPVKQEAVDRTCQKLESGKSEN
jgi:cobalt/nickel transport system ATP-binding protein